MNLTIVRHGQTIENEKGIMQGQNDGTPSSLGVEQNSQVAADLANESFDIIISSDLGRCTALAEKIHTYHQSTLFSLSPALREIHYGSYQGGPVKSLDLSILPGTQLTKKAPGGESWMDLAHRLEVFLNETYVAHKNGNVLLVTHGGPIQVIRAYLEPASLRRLASEPSIPNCAVRRLVMKHPITSVSLD